VLCGILAFGVNVAQWKDQPVLGLLAVLKPYRFFILGIFCLMAVYCWRRIGICKRIRAPGPISVPPLRDETGTSHASIDRLTTSFREKLNQVNIQAPEPVPGGSQQIDFAEVLRSPAAADASNMGTSLAVSLGRLLAAGQISYAYQVNGAIFNSEKGKCGVTVQVMVLPKWASQPITCTGDTWELALERAAYEVSAFILPLTKLVDEPPWPAWRRLAVPPELFRNIQKAQQSKNSRCFDEALRYYYKALKLDPHNPYLRLEVGMLQEQIGMHVDALVTYEDAIKLAPSDLDLKIYHPFRRKPVYFRRKGVSIRGDWWRAPILMARYRQAVLLSMGERLSADWSPHEQVRGLRSEECQNLRKRITESFRHYFEGFQQYLADQEGELDGEGRPCSGQVLPKEVCEVFPEGSIETARLRLFQQEFFQFIGQVRAQQLRRSYFYPRRIPEQKVPRAALRLLLVGNPVRRCWTRVLRHGQKSAFRGLKYISAYRVVKRPAIAKIWHAMRAFEYPETRISWPIEARSISGLMRFSHLLPHWQSYYDTACIYSTCILPIRGGAADVDVQARTRSRYFSDRLDEEGEEIGNLVHKLAERAVYFLELSSQNQDSGFASSIRPWLLADDPDLVGLRRRGEFIRWAEQHYPERYPNRLRPDNVHEIELVHYEQLLVEVSAAVAARVWKHRSAQSQDDALSSERLREWLAEEDRVWGLVHKLVENRRHWQTRCEAIRAMREFGRSDASNGMIHDFTVPYPMYSNDPVIHLRARGDDEFIEKVEEVQKQRNGRIEELRDILECRQAWCLVDVPSSPSPEGISRFCDQLAARWETLARAFREENDGDKLKPIASLDQVGKRPSLFTTANTVS
jgi:tetratricopeptide (TPR) repeat protein